MGFQKGNTYSKGRIPWNKGIPRTEEDKEKSRIKQIRRHHSPNTEFKKGQMSGSNNPMFGKHHSEETKEKIRKNKPDQSGCKSGMWKGGRRLKFARHDAKRKMLGLIPLNEPFEGSQGHHLNKEYVLYIPEELHKSVWHSVLKDINMDLINEKVIDWYINYYGLR